MIRHKDGKIGWIRKDMAHTMITMGFNTGKWYSNPNFPDRRVKVLRYSPTRKSVYIDEYDAGTETTYFNIRKKVHSNMGAHAIILDDIEVSSAQSSDITT